jgi:hypothetical protein
VVTNAPDRSLRSHAVHDDESSRQWISFEHGGDTWMFDATFLASNWTCIFGRGCRGVLDEDATELGHGCCSFGAHMADKADRKRVRSALRRLPAELWQHRDAVDRPEDALHKDEDGTWVTRVHDGACVLLNRPGFGAGSGCALHLAALLANERPLDWKPEVCWQVPIRFEYHDDEVGHTTHVLREWKRRDWGEGGAEFHWWCTDAPDAFVGHEAVVDALRDDIVELVGAEVYERLRSEMGADEPGVTTTWLPHPASRRPSD